MAGRLLMAACAPSAVRRPAPVEQQIERTRIGGQIAPEQAARLEPDAPGPFELRLLHPSRRADAAAGQEVEQSAGRLDDADIGEMRGELLDEGLFVGNAERDPEIVRRQRVDLVDLGAQRLAAEVAVGVPDDLEVRIQLANAARPRRRSPPRPRRTCRRSGRRPAPCGRRRGTGRWSRRARAAASAT